MQKPCDTCWLAREKTVSAVGRSLSALVHTFEKIYNDTGDDEAHGIATLLTKCTEACIYMYLHALTLCLSFKEDSKARILIWPVLLVWLRNTTERKFLNLTLTPKTQNQNGNFRWAIFVRHRGSFLITAVLFALLGTTDY